jgi:16S rRNA (guanine1207-N2)-methyltransferase
MEDRLKTFSRPTQLAVMSLEGVHAENPLIVLPPEPGLPRLFSRVFPRMHVLYHDYAVFRRDIESAPDTVSLRFAPRWEETDRPHDLALIFLPKSTELIEFVFSATGRALAQEARVMIVGPKKSGIRSSRPLIEKYFGGIESSRSARHCVLLESRKTLEPEPFAGIKRDTADAFGNTVRVVSLPGVFSHGHPDEGTRFLLDHAEPEGFQHALDWGCGAGIIGTALKLGCPDATVDFVDSNILALEATRLTLESNGLEPDRVYASDVFSDVKERYGLIISNPPFHQGLTTDFSVTGRMVREAPARLTPSGRLIIVVNAFINFFPLLRRRFGEVSVLAENNRYRVIRASGPQAVGD